jgi:hypothetical protein
MILMTDKTIKAHCPTCGPDRNAAILADHQTCDSDDNAGVWLNTQYSILRCLGCDAIFFRQEATFSEDYSEYENPSTGEPERTYSSKITYWPAPSKRIPPTWLVEMWAIDKQLDDIMTETYTALNNDARILAAIGLRTMFDHVSEILGVDPALSFAAKLQELEKLGKIGREEKETLAILTDAGGAAAHRGWKPSLGQLNTLATIAENFIYRVIMLHADARELKKLIPQKPKRSSGDKT